MCAAQLWRACPDADLHGSWCPELAEVQFAARQLQISGLVTCCRRKENQVTRLFYALSPDVVDEIPILLDNGILDEDFDEKHTHAYIENFLISSR